MSITWNEKNFHDVPVMWSPTGEKRPAAEKFKNLIQDKYNTTFRDYWDFHKWSIENTVEFWSEVWEFIGLIYSKKFEKVLDLSVPMSEMPPWFKGAKLNFAENLLKYRDNEEALILAGEDKKTERVTYAQVYAQTRVYAAAFRKFGVKKGDVVAGYMSNREEPLYAMMAVTSIGAIWSGALPLLGTQPVINRFKQVKPKIMLTMDRFRHNKEENEMLPKVLEICKSLTSLEKVIIVRTRSETKQEDIQQIKNSCFLNDFLRLGYNEDGSVPEMEFEQLSFSHPLFISYTSGTTGLPKAVVHGPGALICTACHYYLHNEGTRDAVVLTTSPVGWASWNMLSMQLFSGIKLLLYEGVPFFLSPTSLWDLVDEFQLSILFVTPNLLDKMEKDGYVPTKRHSLKSLKAIASGGSVVKNKNYEFVQRKIKKDIIFMSAYGSTELMSASMTFDISLPIHKGEIQCPAVGVDIACLDASGKPVLGEIGPLVLRRNLPSLPLGLWGDTDGSLFRKTYFPNYSDKFELGDLGMINPVTRGTVIYCRSDETLKPKTVRFGSSEIYDIVNKFPDVSDSLCVAQFNEVRDERAVLFVKTADGFAFDDNLVRKIELAITKEMAKDYVPELILETKDIPYNLNGKKMEITVKKIINNMPYNADTIVNQESLDNYRNVPAYL